MHHATSVKTHFSLWSILVSTTKFADRFFCAKLCIHYFLIFIVINSLTHWRSKLSWTHIAVVALIILTLLRLFFCELERKEQVQKARERDLKRVIYTSQLPVRKIEDHIPFKNFLSEHPIYLVMTSIPDRLNEVPKILSGLDTSLVKSILIALPERFERTGQTYHIPTALQDNPQVQIIRSARDYGPITKLLPALQHTQHISLQAIFIIIDDDHFYPRGMIHEYAYALWNNPHQVFSGQVADLGPRTRIPYSYAIDPHAPPKWWPDQAPELLHGAYSIGFVNHALNASWFLDLLKFEANLGQYDCRYNDDFLISYALRQKGLSFSTLNTDYFSFQDIQPMEANYWTDALHLLPLNVHRQFWWRWSAPPELSETHQRLNRCLHTIHAFSTAPN